MVLHYRSNPDEGIQAMTAASRAVTPRWAGLPALAITIVAIALFAHWVSRQWLHIVFFAWIAVWTLPLVTRLEQRLRWHRAIEADPHADEEQHVEIGDAGLRFWCDHAQSELAWSGIRRVQETAEHYIFVCGPLGACAVPKRVIPPDDESGLRDLIRRRSPDGGKYLAREVELPAAAT